MTDKILDQHKMDVLFRNQVNHFYNLLEEAMKSLRNPTYDLMSDIYWNMYMDQVVGDPNAPALELAWAEFNRDFPLPEDKE